MKPVIRTWLPCGSKRTDLKTSIIVDSSPYRKEALIIIPEGHCQRPYHSIRRDNILACIPPYFLRTNGMRCCRSDWPGLCLFTPPPPSLTPGRPLCCFELRTACAKTRTCSRPPISGGRGLAPPPPMNTFLILLFHRGGVRGVSLLDCFKGVSFYLETILISRHSKYPRSTAKLSKKNTQKE